MGDSTTNPRPVKTRRAARAAAMTATTLSRTTTSPTRYGTCATRSRLSWRTKRRASSHTSATAAADAGPHSTVQACPMHQAQQQAGGGGPGGRERQARAAASRGVRQRQEARQGRARRGGPAQPRQHVLHELGPASAQVLPRAHRKSAVRRSPNEDVRREPPGITFGFASNTKELREYFLTSYTPRTASAFEGDEGTRTRSSNSASPSGPYVLRRHAAPCVGYAWPSVNRKTCLGSRGSSSRPDGWRTSTTG